MTEIHKGLIGVVADQSAVSHVFEESNQLTYYGYSVNELAEHCVFEEVAYLLWHKELPNAAQLSEFQKIERENRSLSQGMLQLIPQLSKTAHPMDKLRSLISLQGVEQAAEIPPAKGFTPELTLKYGMKMLATIPLMVAAIWRAEKGLPIIEPRHDLGLAENFFHCCFGKVPEPEIIRCFETSLTLYAEHGFNASTFTARVIASSLSDVYGSITGAIASLKGPLHGGANEAVMHMMLEIGTPAQASAWLSDALEKKKLIFGFGHRVYKDGDTRVPIMKQALEKVSALRPGQPWLEIYDVLAAYMLEHKNIHPNLDFPAGPAYYMMGFDIPIYTPIFVISRITGWVAHYLEQMQHGNKLIRPLSVYNGVAQRVVPQK
ncbi:MAG: bifunctional 2-methylcitrate synthase/citrate synthase [Alphaproteobacteria bacterium]